MRDFGKRLHQEMAHVHVSPALRRRTLAAVKGKEPVMKRKWGVALAVALVTVLLCAVALAVAARQGMIDFLGRMSTLPPDAADMLQYDVASQGAEGVEVNLRELYYDGRTVRAVVDVTPRAPGMLLCGVDTMMQNSWQDLISLGEGDPSDTRTVLQVYQEEGYAHAYNVNLSLYEPETGYSPTRSLDFVLGEDGTLTYYMEAGYETDSAQREALLRVSVTAYGDPAQGEATLDFDARQTAELPVTLIAQLPEAQGDTLENTYICTEPVVYEQVGVRIDWLLVEVRDMEIYATLQYTVIDEQTYADTFDAMIFEFIDPASTAAAPYDQRLKSGVGDSFTMPPQGDSYVQVESLSYDELHETYTLRAFNFEDKTRYDTHTLTVHPATQAEVQALEIPQF